MPDNNYVIGRGKVYFEKFNSQTDLTGDGERYLGNTPALSMNNAYTNLDHYSSDYGTRIKDDSVQLQLDRSGTFQCDNITMDNVALMFGGNSEIETQAAVTGAAEVIVVKKGLFYQLGADDSVPDGSGAVTNVVVTNNAGARATGTLTFSGQPTADTDFVTINGQQVDFVSGTPTGFQVQVGATTSVTAAALAELINEFPHIFKVTAAAVTTVVTLTAIATGTGPNSYGTVVSPSATGPTAGAATLTGGTNSGIIVMPGNYEIDLTRARLHILADADSIADDDDLEVVYNISAGSRSLVIDENDQVLGALRFTSDNATGLNKDYFWPLVKVTPNGEYALKGDTWQVMNFNFDVLQKAANLKRVYIREVPNS